MLTQLKRAGLIWPTLFALPALALLLGLGTWQLQRKAWKDELQAQIKARASAKPAALADVLGNMSATHPPGTPVQFGEYSRVRVNGTYENGKELYFFAPHPQFGPGYHVYAPLILAQTDCLRFVMVNRGFVPEALRAPDKRAADEPAGPTEVVGLIRYPEKPASFTPANEPQRNLWFWRDLAGMTAAVAAGRKACAVHFFIDAEAAPANPGGWPRGGTTNLNLPNRHLEYALTWYGLAATLIGVFAAFAWPRLKPSREP